MASVKAVFLLQANEDVTQIVKVMYTDTAKWNWLTSNLVHFCTSEKSLCQFCANSISCATFCDGFYIASAGTVCKMTCRCWFHTVHITCIYYSTYIQYDSFYSSFWLGYCLYSIVGSVLIFVTRKTNSEELANNLKQRDFKSE